MLRFEKRKQEEDYLSKLEHVSGDFNRWITRFEDQVKVCETIGVVLTEEAKMFYFMNNLNDSIFGTVKANFMELSTGVLFPETYDEIKQRFIAEYGAPARISGRPSPSSGEVPAPAASSSSGMPTSALEAPAHTPMATHEHTGANGDSPPGSFNEAPRRPATRRPQRVAPLPDGAYSAGSPDSSFSDPNDDDPPRSAQRGAHPCPYPQCNRRYSSVQDTVKHMNKDHHGDNFPLPRKYARCSVCTYAYTKGGLKNHRCKGPPGAPREPGTSLQPLPSPEPPLPLPEHHLAVAPDSTLSIVSTSSRQPGLTRNGDLISNNSFSSYCRGLTPTT